MRSAGSSTMSALLRQAYEESATDHFFTDCLTSLRSTAAAVRYSNRDDESHMVDVSSCVVVQQHALSDAFATKTENFIPRYICTSTRAVTLRILHAKRRDIMHLHVPPGPNYPVLFFITNVIHLPLSTLSNKLFTLIQVANYVYP